MTAPLAILFHRLGPYHHARIEAVARGGPTLAVEYSSADRTYAWTSLAPSGAFPTRTLLAETEVLAEPITRTRARVFEVLDEVRPGVVAIPGWSAPPSLMALEWCRQRRVPAVLMSDSQESDAVRNFAGEWVKRRLVRQFSAGLVAGVPHQRYLRRLGMPEELIFTGYDVVENAHFSRGAEAARANAPRLRQELSLPERYFLASSRFVPKKNLERLLEAYSTYRRASGAHAWKLVLLGDGVLRPELVRRREQLGLVDDLLMPGFKQYDELPAYYGLAKAFIHASTTEQWGLVVNEAMAAGLPVLVSRACGCVPDLVRDGVNGYAFDPLDPAQLAGWLRSFSAGEVDLPGMGLASRELIAGWGPERFAASLRAAAGMAGSRAAAPAGSFELLLLRGLTRR